MNCPNHPKNEVTGYCSVCASFGCAECLKMHEGNLVCPKHYAPVARQLEEEARRADVRKKHVRQRLVVRFKDGRTVGGVCFALNIAESGFHLDVVDTAGASLGQTQYMLFRELKAVFYVKSFDGNFDKTIHYREWNPEGGELVVVFKDGEILRGFSLHKYNPDSERFYVMPVKADTNNISMLVEASAVEAVYTVEEYKAKKAREAEAQKETGAPTSLSQEESLGDFYFETRNYDNAYEQYRLAAGKAPQSSRLRKKLILTQYNMGMQFIKKRQYQQALAQMEAVLKLDPKNSHATKKRMQLQKVLAKGSAEAGAGDGGLDD